MTLGPLPIDERRSETPGDRRSQAAADRRARPRGGRRGGDARTPWYRRRRLWLAAASIAYVTWRRLHRTGAGT
jgi:hypothetical protein